MPHEKFYTVSHNYGNPCFFIVQLLNKQTQSDKM